MKKNIIFSLIFGLLSFLCCAFSTARPSDLPQPIDPYVNDFARIITPEDATKIKQCLANFKTQKGVECTVVTVPSIATYAPKGTSLEVFATALFNQWGVGDRKRNDGIMLLVALQDRKIRIELGMGYGRSNNKKAQEIISRVLSPKLKAGHMSEGIREGAESIASSFNEGTSKESTPPFFVMIFIWLGLFSIFWVGAALCKDAQKNGCGNTSCTGCSLCRYRTRYHSRSTNRSFFGGGRSGGGGASGGF